MTTNPKEIFFCKLVADEGLTVVVVLGGVVVTVTGAPVVEKPVVIVGLTVGTRGAVVVVWTPKVVVSDGVGSRDMEGETSGLGETETEAEGEAETDDIVVVFGVWLLVVVE